MTRDEEARAILKGNDRGGYTVPTAGLYPYQWNWDSVFAALGFAEHDMARAWDELDTLFAGQWNNGMVPHILFHKVDPGYFPGPDVWRGVGLIPSSGISQPPIAGTFVRWLLEMDESFAARAEALVPKLVDWHRWFMTWRCEGGAIVVTHPWETGRDNCPDWDGPFAAIEPVGIESYRRRDTTHVVEEERPLQAQYDRFLYLVKLGAESGWDEAHLREANPFRVADPTMTFTLLRSTRDLLVLAERFGGPRDEIAGWIATMEEGAERLWNAEAQTYDTFDERAGRHSGVVSNASFLSWYAGVGGDRMLPQLERVMGLETYGIPSTDPAHPAYEPKRYWRGPVWAMMNLLIAKGLAEQGHGEWAGKITENTRAMIAENGFAEYFDPRDGAPAGGRNFTWTAAVWLAWASPTAGRNAWAA
ncbi:hypothetical protein [Oceanicola sp. 502str15]|uniref:MGH1-like glycoside hydrolase domain-containing protein n=1 Tax=Oceanicola sp. 502str15 TaxID=2696061 RepID=UPI002095883D|nr:hypothetical protein [Oceanicola sp. 502str15]MCO6384347.1 hypothetical protein [Oceanicola sp. 502str15]